MPDVWARFTGRMDGKFHPLDPHRFQKTIKDLAGKSVEVAIIQERQKRTLDQNAYLHVIAREIAKASGETIDRIKRMAVIEALGFEAGTERETYLGKEVLVIRRTSELRKDDCIKVLDWMLDKAAFLEIRLPDREHVEVMA